MRIERGSLAGTSEGVLDALATALQLNEAERDHLFHLARQSGAPGGRRHRKPAATVRPTLQEVLDAIYRCAGVDPQWPPRRARHESTWSRAVFTGAGRPATARQHSAVRVSASRARPETFFVDYDQAARNAAAMLRMEAGRNPHDEELIALVGELSTCSELFRQQWASQDVRLHGPGASVCTIRWWAGST